MSIKYVQTLGVPLWRRCWSGPSARRRFPQTLCSLGSWWHRACIYPRCPKRPTPRPRPSCLTTHPNHRIELTWVRSKFRLICIRCSEMGFGTPTLWAGDDPWGEDVSASQNSTATLGADHNLWAEPLHTSVNKRKKVSFASLDTYLCMFAEQYSSCIAGDYFLTIWVWQSRQTLLWCMTLISFCVPSWNYWAFYSPW